MLWEFEFLTCVSRLWLLEVSKEVILISISFFLSKISRCWWTLKQGSFNSQIVLHWISPSYQPLRLRLASDWRQLWRHTLMRSVYQLLSNCIVFSTAIMMQRPNRSFLIIAKLMLKPSRGSLYWRWFTATFMQIQLWKNIEPENSPNHYSSTEAQS